ncbi:MAG TPA: hypothetical protein VF407_00065 [Polyangiaceae bacterium]
MGCFTAPTEVHSTNIFARMTAPGTEALVYQMEYSAQKPTAMILPLPVALPASESSVTWKDLKAYPTFFADLALAFPAEEPRSQSMAKSAAAEAVPLGTIQVHEVGDFIASFVPSQADFTRLDPRFVITSDVWAAFPEYKDYGFAVFQLKELSGAPHPIAFTFQSRLKDALYFPTVHIHDGTAHKQDQFDHVLYVQDARFDAKVHDYDGPNKADKATGYVRSKDNAKASVDVGSALGLVDGDHLIHKTTLTGMLPNKDTIVGLDLPAASSGCGRCDFVPRHSELSLGPAALSLAGLAWVIRRRNRIRRR